MYYRKPYFPFLFHYYSNPGVHNVAQQMRHFDAQPHRAVRLLLGSLLTFT